MLELFDPVVDTTGRAIGVVVRLSEVPLWGVDIRLPESDGPVARTGNTSVDPLIVAEDAGAADSEGLELAGLAGRFVSGVEIELFDESEVVEPGALSD